MHGTIMHQQTPNFVCLTSRAALRSTAIPFIHSTYVEYAAELVLCTLGKAALLAVGSASHCQPSVKPQTLYQSESCQPGARSGGRKHSRQVPNPCTHSRLAVLGCCARFSHTRSVQGNCSD